MFCSSGTYQAFVGTYQDRHRRDVPVTALTPVLVGTLAPGKGSLDSRPATGFPVGCGSATGQYYSDLKGAADAERDPMQPTSGRKPESECTIRFLDRKKPSISASASEGEFI